MMVRRRVFENRNAMIAFGGLDLILVYCVLATCADAIARTVAQSFAAPQLFFFSGLVVASLSFVTLRFGKNQSSLRSVRPRSLALRSLLVIISSVFYFIAFRTLPFAEVFVFIALVPIFAALLSGPILGEQVRAQSWCALLASVGGMFLLHPEGVVALNNAHLCAILGAFTGAGAMVLARHISRDEKNTLLQVFYPNLAICVVMGAVLPFFYKPMTASDVILIASYASILFIARWVLVLVLTKMKAYVATLLMNLQFVAMIIAGVVLFSEIPTLGLMIGAGVIMMSGAYIVLDTARSDRTLVTSKS
jgi:drug/metabolite transporter (DMT)-like permease